MKAEPSSKSKLLFRKRSPRKYAWGCVLYFFLFAALVGVYYAAGIKEDAFAFMGPSQPTGSGSGAIGVDASNNLSIGTPTPSPGVKLFLMGATNDSTAHAFSVVNRDSIPILGARNDGFVGIGASAPAPQAKLDVGGGTDILFRLSRIGATHPTIFREGTDGALVIQNSGLDTLTLKGGNVGVGADPAYSLDVNGDMQVRGGEIFGIRGITGLGNVSTGWFSDSGNLSARIPGEAGGFFVQTSSGALTFLGVGPVVSGMRLYLGNAVFDQRVGINVTDPAEKLDIFNGATDTMIKLSRGGALLPTLFRMGTDGAFIIRNSGLETLTLKDGRVGIGIDPIHKLHVAGDIYANDLRLWPENSKVVSGGDFNQYLAINDLGYDFVFSGGNAGGIFMKLGGWTSSLAGGERWYPVKPSYALEQFSSGYLAQSASGWDTTAGASTNTTMFIRTFAGSGPTGAIPYRMGIFSNIYDIYMTSSTPPGEFVTFDGLNQRVGIGITAPQSGLHVADGKYAQFEDSNAGPPPGADCDSNSERGRMSIDAANNRLYVCNGASRGWDFINLTDF